MTEFEVHYRYKATRRGNFTIRVKAVDKKDAKRLVYEKIDNRIYEIIDVI